MNSQLCPCCNTIICENINHVSPKNLKFAYNRFKKTIKIDQCWGKKALYSDEFLDNFVECSCFDLYEGSIQFAEIFNHLLINFNQYFESNITFRCVAPLMK